MQSAAADFEPGTFTFTTGSMSTARSLHTANLLGDGRVLLAGGVNAAGQNVASAELYDPASGTFTLTAGFIVGGANPIGALSSAEIYVVVPEPSTWALALAALACLGGC